jgi:hypothetical protein
MIGIDNHGMTRMLLFLHIYIYICIWTMKHENIRSIYIYIYHPPPPPHTHIHMQTETEVQNRFQETLFPMIVLFFVLGVSFYGFILSLIDAPFDAPFESWRMLMSLWMKN